MAAGIERISRNSFIVIGRAGMDFYPDPPGTKTEEAERFVADMGGSAGNICAAIVKHGGSSALLSCVSDDAVGRFCLNQLDRFGIGREHVRTVGGEARNSLAVAESTTEDHQTVIYRNGAADFELRPEDAEIDYSAYCSLIVTGTALAAEPSRSATLRSLELAKDAGLLLILDIDYRAYSWESAEIAAEVCTRAAEMCDIIVGNDVEFGVMAGNPGRGLERARELARSAAGFVIHKMGEEGALTITAEEEFRTGIYPVTALKPFGAGDAFMGGLVTSLAAGCPLRESVLRGSACASIAVSRVGCAAAMPTTAELEDFLASHPGPTQA